MTSRSRLSGFRAVLGLAAAPLLLALAGCLNWQGTYDEAARSQCRSSPDASERRACLDRVQDNSRDKHAEHRGD